MRGKDANSFVSIAASIPKSAIGAALGLSSLVAFGYVSAWTDSYFYGSDPIPPEHAYQPLISNTAGAAGGALVAASWNDSGSPTGHTKYVISYNATWVETVRLSQYVYGTSATTGVWSFTPPPVRAASAMLYYGDFGPVMIAAQVANF